MRSQSVGRVRWIIVGFLFVETILNFLDLETLSVVAPILSVKLNLTGIAYARIMQVFELAYLLGFLFGGWVIDRLGVRPGLAVAMAWWSLAEFAHGFARSARGLMLCRLVLGIAYPGAYLAAAKAAAEWYPAQERALVTGLYTAGATIGATVAPPLVAWLALGWGWQYAFFVPGLAGLVYVVFWLLFYRDPEHHRLLSETERHYILSGRPAVEKSATSWRESLPYLLKSRTFWAMFVAKLIGDPPLIFYVYWLPKFLSETQGLDMRAIGHVAWIPFLFADVGSVAGGWLSGRWVRRGINPVEARLKLMLWCAGVSALAFTIYFVHSTAVIIGLMSLMTLAVMGWMVNLSTLPIDVFPAGIASTAVGLTTVGVVLGQIIFTYAVGRIVQTYSYGPLFFIMSAMAPTAYCFFRIIVKGANRVEPMPVFS